MKRRFQLEVKDDIVSTMSKKLQSILGFNQTTFGKGKYEANRIPLLNRNIHHLYLYSNIISPIYVGGQRVPLLRYIPIPTSEYGDTIYKEFLNPAYLPLSVGQLQQIDIALYDDTGEEIYFEEGRTLVTLHFRRINFKQ